MFIHIISHFRADSKADFMNQSSNSRLRSLSTQLTESAQLCESCPDIWVRSGDQSAHPDTSPGRTF